MNLQQILQAIGYGSQNTQGLPVDYSTGMAVASRDAHDTAGKQRFIDFGVNAANADRSSRNQEGMGQDAQGVDNEQAYSALLSGLDPASKIAEMFHNNAQWDNAGGDADVSKDQMIGTELEGMRKAGISSDLDLEAKRLANEKASQDLFSGGSKTLNNPHSSSDDFPIAMDRSGQRNDASYHAYLDQQRQQRLAQLQEALMRNQVKQSDLQTQGMEGGMQRSNDIYNGLMPQIMRILSGIGRR